MNSKLILDRFKKMLLMEKKAKERYVYYISQVDDAEIKKYLLSISDEEKGHIEIIKKIISYLTLFIFFLNNIS